MNFVVSPKKASFGIFGNMTQILHGSGRDRNIDTVIKAEVETLERPWILEVLWHSVYIAYIYMYIG